MSCGPWMCETMTIWHLRLMSVVASGIVHLRIIVVVAVRKESERQCQICFFCVTYDIKGVLFWREIFNDTILLLCLVCHFVMNRPTPKQRLHILQIYYKSIVAVCVTHRALRTIFGRHDRAVESVIQVTTDRLTLVEKCIEEDPNEFSRRCAQPLELFIHFMENSSEESSFADFQNPTLEESSRRTSHFRSPIPIFKENIVYWCGSHLERW